MKASSQPKIPKNHQVVLQTIRTAGHGVHLTMNDVFARAKKLQPKIGFSTVYRGIQRLRDLHLIDEISVPGSDAAVYETVSDPHTHFRCDRCGVIEDVAYQVQPKAIAEMSERSGAQITRATLTLHGRCRSCRD
jgi:Fur family peroxide stress response transcriptional regulator